MRPIWLATLFTLALFLITCGASNEPTPSPTRTTVTVAFVRDREIYPGSMAEWQRRLRERFGDVRELFIDDPASFDLSAYDLIVVG